jgi:hypothetical protein
VPEHDDLKFLELCGSKEEKDDLQKALKGDRTD